MGEGGKSGDSMLLGRDIEIEGERRCCVPGMSLVDWREREMSEQCK